MNFTFILQVYDTFNFNKKKKNFENLFFASIQKKKKFQRKNQRADTRAAHVEIRRDVEPHRKPECAPAKIQALIPPLYPAVFSVYGVGEARAENRYAHATPWQNNRVGISIRERHRVYADAATRKRGTRGNNV